jgi:hypothetical protein
VRHIHRAQDQRVEHAEGDCVGTNCDGEGQNGGKGEAGGFTQHPESEAQILK